MDTRSVMSRRAAIKGAIIAAAIPTAASALPPDLGAAHDEGYHQYLYPSETGEQKIARLAEELRQAVSQMQGGDWKADLCLDAGLIIVRITA